MWRKNSASRLFALYGSKAYVDRNGLPQDDNDLNGHAFVAHDNGTTQAPFYRWLSETVPESSRRFRITDTRVGQDAVLAGAGLGFFPVFQAQSLPDLVQALPPRAEWSARMWLVTHVDLHRTPKVQTFLKFLKSEAESWPGFEFLA